MIQADTKIKKYKCYKDKEWCHHLSSRICAKNIQKNIQIADHEV